MVDRATNSDKSIIQSSLFNLQDCCTCFESSIKVLRNEDGRKYKEVGSYIYKDSDLFSTYPITQTYSITQPVLRVNRPLS